MPIKAFFFSRIPNISCSFCTLSYASALKKEVSTYWPLPTHDSSKSVILDALEVSLSGGWVDCKIAADVRQHTARRGKVVTVGVRVLVAFPHYVLLMAIISLEWDLSPSRC